MKNTRFALLAVLLAVPAFAAAGIYTYEDLAAARGGAPTYADFLNNVGQAQSMVPMALGGENPSVWYGVILAIDRAPAGSITVWNANFSKKLVIPNSATPLVLETKSFGGVTNGAFALCHNQKADGSATADEKGSVLEIYRNSDVEYFQLQTGAGVKFFRRCAPL